MDDTKPSKSARKREHIALQKLGEELISLRESEIEALPIDDDLREAVLEARRISANGALRRQKQYIGKLMRQVDPEPIRAALARISR